jgi:hypothetical protein
MLLQVLPTGFFAAAHRRPGALSLITRNTATPATTGFEVAASLHAHVVLHNAWLYEANWAGMAYAIKLITL